MSRLNAGTIIALMVAILLSLAGAFLARQLLITQQPPPAEPPPEPKVVIPVATTDLPAGRELKDGDVGKLELTREQLRTQNLPRVYMTSPTEIVGRTLREPLKSGQAFSPDSLYPQGVGPSLAEELSAGLRGVTIGVTDAGFVNGFANPGSFVDVLFRLSPSSQIPAAVTPLTYTILENIRVLAVERSAFPGSQQDPRQFGLSKVTLAVTADQAAQLKVLEGNGELVLTLRSADDVPKEELERLLSETSERLQSLEAESLTLGQIRNAAQQIGSEFDDRGRSDELAREIDRQQQQLADLRQRVQQVTQPQRVQSLDSILQLKTTQSIADKLQPGMRAVTVGIKGSGFVDGFAVPGTRVDVLFRLSSLDGRGDYRETTFTLLESVEVLAIAHSTDARPLDARGRGDETIPVTLAVNASDAGKLKVVEGRGELSLVLRPMDEPGDSADSLARGSAADARGRLADELQEAQAELEDLLVERQALQQLDALSQRRQIQFTGQERLGALDAMILEAQQRVEQLTADAAQVPQEQIAARPQYTLNDVLGIPDPPTPPPDPIPAPVHRDVMEIYRGGARSLMVFEQTRGGAAASTVGFSGGADAASDPTGSAAAVSPSSGSGGSSNGGASPAGSGCKDCGSKSVLQRPL